MLRGGNSVAISDWSLTFGNPASVYVGVLVPTPLSHPLLITFSSVKTGIGAFPTSLAESYPQGKSGEDA